MSVLKNAEKVINSFIQLTEDRSVNAQQSLEFYLKMIATSYSDVYLNLSSLLYPIVHFVKLVYYALLVVCGPFLLVAALIIGKDDLAVQVIGGMCDLVAATVLEVVNTALATVFLGTRFLASIFNFTTAETAEAEKDHVNNICSWAAPEY